MRGESHARQRDGALVPRGCPHLRGDGARESRLRQDGRQPRHQSRQRRRLGHVPLRGDQRHRLPPDCQRLSQRRV